MLIYALYRKSHCGNNMSVPAKKKREKKRSLDRALARAWRKAHGLTLQELGQGFDPPRSLQRVRDIEDQAGHMTVTLILELIQAFRRIGKPIPGATDQLCLSTFFAGPDLLDARAAQVKADRDVAEMEAGVRE